MKNKGFTYLMLVIAVGLWGGIFYKFFSAINEDSGNAISVQPRFKKASIATSQEDTFVLMANYRDPFLGRLAHSNQFAERNYDQPSNYIPRKSAKRKPLPPPPIPVPIIPIQWPSLKYLGIIQNKNTDKLVGILQINGQEQMVKFNDIAIGIKIVGINKDTIGLLFQDNKKTLYKGQSFP